MTIFPALVPGNTHLILGCFRSRLERLDWMLRERSEQQATLIRCDDRRKQYQRRRFSWK